MADHETQAVHQPIHPLIHDRLDAEYIEFHNKYLQHVVPADTLPWDPSTRSQPSHLARGGLPIVEVGSVQDEDLGNFQARIFTPHGNAPSAGWPIVIWFHGGGFVMGGLGSENGFLRHVCKNVGCITMSINYRHAPEHVYPAAINDVVAGYRWAVDATTVDRLRINTSRIVIGGLSAGGCLAAILSLKIAALDIVPKPVLQVLLCPVIDNIATTSTTWATSQYSPWLTPSRMQWYREKYLPRASDASNWDASPLFALPELLRRSPKTFMAIAGCDLLAPEDHKYADLLKQVGVVVDIQVYPGATHSILMLAGIHKAGKKLVDDVCTALKRSMYE